ncbi:MAG: glycosyltransferase family 4 protein [Chloroflexota bacterium]
MKIAYVSHYFVPEIAAPSVRLHGFGRHWTAEGHEVTVLTGFPNHPTGVIPPAYQGKILLEERLDGIRVLRNWLYATPNRGFALKTLGHLSFMISAVALGLPRLGPVDVVIATSPTFFTAISAWVISRLRGVPMVFEVRDLWPAVFVDLGVLRNPLIIKLLEAMELFFYRQSAAVVPVTEAFRTAIVKRGIPAEKIHVIPNGADIETYRPDIDGARMRQELGLGDRFVVSYMGSHGISHGLSTVLDAAQRHRDQPDVLYLLIGEGAEKEMLLATRDQLGLDNVLMLPHQAPARMPELYAASDVCLVPLRDVPIFETFVPSKLFEILAMGRPIIGSVRGEAQSILERSGGALLIPPEDPTALVAAIDALRHDPARRAAMGRSGRAFLETNYSHASLARRYLEVLQGLIPR